ncbi:uracil-DNA glycosylase [Paenibacillus herberti]|uniref:Uracil-DNA glycosylase n=1 Tax=Paenibacillus herberti TaxID=1619309 RepID=A0A229P1H6_9BACL|nr:uracil-DNA glycosylase [Paenibacillus herberti]OXM15769.1 uracil-DNA glycosylase [Paenibacillus herberti]
MTVQFRNDWAQHLIEEMEQPYYLELRSRLVEEYRGGAVYPDMHDIFNALYLTSLGGTKVVILGQDPYHGPGQAHGLSFSVQPGVRIPPSLQNIYKELHADIGCPIPMSGDLRGWARQGVLLLNNVLTVRKGAAASHQGLGWEAFTDRIVRLIGEREQPAVFLLWGKHTQEKASFLDGSRHLLLSTPHPSPFSAHRGFLGSKPFSKANAFLEKHGMEPIDWCRTAEPSAVDETAAGSDAGTSVGATRKQPEESESQPASPSPIA